MIILSNIKKSLQNLIDKYVNEESKDKVYNPLNRTVDISKVVDSETLMRLFVGDFFGMDSFYYQKLFDLEMGRTGRYSDYENIYYKIPEAAKAVSIYVDETLAPNLGKNNNNLVFTPIAGPRGEKGEEIGRIIFSRTGIEKVLPQIVFNTLLYGDCFLEIRKTVNNLRYVINDPKKCTILYDKILDIEVGMLVELNMDTQSPLANLLLEKFPDLKIDAPRKKIIIANEAGQRIEKIDIDFQALETLLMEALDNTGAQLKYIRPGHYVHFALSQNSLYYPYGTSILDNIRSISKQLLINEAALTVNRLTRAPNRNIYTVEVGGMPEDRVRGFLERVKNSMKRSSVLNTDNGFKLDSLPDVITHDEDYWIPAIDGQRAVEIEHLEGDSLQTDIDDIDYFHKKLLSALGIPPAYLANEEGTSTRALLSLEDIRFSRTIKKIQTDINYGLNNLMDNCFEMLKYPTLKGSVELALPTPQNLEDNIRLENMSNRLTVAGSLRDLVPGIPTKWLLNSIVGITDEELDEMMGSIDDQEKYAAIFNVKPEEAGGGLEPMGDFGGMSDFDTGDAGAQDETLSDLGDIEMPMEETTEQTTEPTI